jgi:hypothetical protein
MLHNLSSDLNAVYDRILSRIHLDRAGKAKFVLSCVVLVRRPLTVDDLAVAYALGLGDPWGGGGECGEEMQYQRIHCVV